MCGCYDLIADTVILPVRFLDEAITDYSHMNFLETVAETVLGFLPSSVAECVRKGLGNR